MTKAPAKIRLGDLVRVLEQGNITDRSRFAWNLKRDTDVLDSAFEAFIEVLNRHTLADFKPAPSRRGGKPSARTTTAAQQMRIL